MHSLAPRDNPVYHVVHNQGRDPCPNRRSTDGKQQTPPNSS
jgi:hypothetical protein